MHISFAITIVVEGFYPQNSAGYTITHFSSFRQALPLITLVISMVSSSFGMTKFFLQGPFPILPKDSSLNGLISLPFICTLLINTMFAFRMICIENSLFSAYRYQRYYTYKSGFDEITIDPILPPEYRVAAYLTPCLISFVINAIKLFTTGNNLRHLIKKYPQILISSCFTPFAFEGCNGNSIRLWKCGTIVNALFIGCFPQIVSLIMDYQRGIVNWDFIGLALEPEAIYENNDALFKSRYGNSLFAITSGVFFFFLIILTFFSAKIFKHRGVYCKCFYILCLPCPNNCINLNSEIPPIQTEPTNPSPPDDDREPETKQRSSTSQEKDNQKANTELYFYSKGIRIYLIGKPLAEQDIELKQVILIHFVVHEIALQNN